MIEEAVRHSGRRIKGPAVYEALREYVRLWSKEALLGLPGRVRLEENWRALRGAELDESG